MQASCARGARAPRDVGAGKLRQDGAATSASFKLWFIGGVLASVSSHDRFHLTDVGNGLLLVDGERGSGGEVVLWCCCYANPSTGRSA